MASTSHPVFARVYERLSVAMDRAGAAEHRRALAAAPDAILNTPLLPGEDPALLRGPDRNADQRVRDGGVAAVLAEAAALAGSGR